jgi:hypothetical protein
VGTVTLVAELKTGGFGVPFAGWELLASTEPPPPNTTTVTPISNMMNFCILSFPHYRQRVNAHLANFTHHRLICSHKAKRYSK